MEKMKFVMTLLWIVKFGTCIMTNDAYVTADEFTTSTDFSTKGLIDNIFAPYTLGNTVKHCTATSDVGSSSRWLNIKFTQVTVV